MQNTAPRSEQWLFVFPQRGEVKAGLQARTDSHFTWKMKRVSLERRHVIQITLMSRLQLPERWTELPRDAFLDADAQGRYRIPLRVDEPSRLPRRSHPVTSGVP